VRIRRQTSVVLAALAVAGCAGPQAKVTITGKQVPIAVAFGKPTALGGNTPQPPTVLVPGPSGVGVVVVPARPGGSASPTPSSSPAPVPSAPCPTPKPGSAAPEAAPSSTKGVPKNNAVTAVRAFRSTTDAKGTITQQETGFLKTFGASSAPSGQSTFQVGLSVFGVDSVTEYQVVPPAFAAPTQATTGLISISFVTADGGLGYQQSFRPKSPLQVFAQAAYAGESWTSASTDPTTGSAAQVTGQVVAEEPVLICGGVLDAWRAETQVHVTNPTQDITTTVTTWFATQHGGVPLAQTQSYQGTAGGEAVKGTTSWVVNADVWAG
jgi:hypothetical protein